MRKAFVEALCGLAEADQRIVLLTADLGWSVLEPFAQRFTNRFFNVGVAEHLMIGAATGLAEAGYMPWCYSIAPFAVMRPYEAIRLGPVLHELPVRIVGVGGGFDYGSNGVTHYALEDLALMRAQPEMMVLAPADSEQATNIVLELGFAHHGPAYLRLGKGEASVPGLKGRFELGLLQTLHRGRDAALLALGPMAGPALQAAGRLQLEEGIDCEVAVCASVVPAPVGGICDLLERHRTLVVVENHYVRGGLGSMVCEIAATGSRCRVFRHGAESMPRLLSGSQAYMEARAGLDGEGIAKAVLRALASR